MRNVIRALLLAALAACSGRDDDADHAGNGAVTCEDPMPAGCEFVADDSNACPRSLCARCAVATIDCCRCTPAGWRVEQQQCDDPCDAGAIDASSVDAP